MLEKLIFNQNNVFQMAIFLVLSWLRVLSEFFNFFSNWWCIIFFDWETICSTVQPNRNKNSKVKEKKAETHFSLVLSNSNSKTTETDLWGLTMLNVLLEMLLTAIRFISLLVYSHHRGNVNVFPSDVASTHRCTSTVETRAD